MEYFGDVYRPPSEARSLIVQATVGCSNNTCTFCNMYKKDQFRIRKVEEVLADLEEIATVYPNLRRIFIADGDALVLKTEYWVTMLDRIKELFPYLDRVSAYATAADINRKSDEDLALLHEKGLEMLYLGFESGNDEILVNVKRNMQRSEYLTAMEKAKKAGFQTSVTVIAGLGGRKMWKESALDTASLISITKPTYLSYLTLNLMEGTELYDMASTGEFVMPSPEEILYEIRVFLEYVDSEGTIFRSNHASNYVTLKGMLNTDRKRLIRTIDRALEAKAFKPEIYRGF